ncbi:MAG: hypothetical protein JO331_13950 [Verrucomicrobia bacterium]|nr:hypothetical protein [Verrucomicrobiota bacterium]
MLEFRPLCQNRAQTYTQEIEMAEAAMATSNGALIKSGYDAFARGDLRGAFAAWGCDIRWTKRNAKQMQHWAASAVEDFCD